MKICASTGEECTRDRWISVDTELPEEDRLVLLWTEHGPAVGCRSLSHDGCWKIGNDYISWDHDFSLGVEEISDWMPITPKDQS